MPELRSVIQKHGGKLPRFSPAGSEVDIYAIPYKDKVREQARQKRLKQELDSGGKNAKRIKAEMRKAEKERKQRERRKSAIEKGRNPDKKRGRRAQINDEWENLAKEERLYKKLRSKKISQEQYDEQMNASWSRRWFDLYCILYLQGERKASHSPNGLLCQNAAAYAIASYLTHQRITM